VALNKVKDIALDSEKIGILSEVVINVRQPPFNATCNGVDDNRPAIQAAIDYANTLPNGGTVFIPGGSTCLLNSSQTGLKDKVSIAGKRYIKNSE
jgi:polygalacturonase